MLLRFNFKITYVTGASNSRADALSRRDQDIPKDAQDDRLQERNMQLIKPEWVQNNVLRVSASTPARTEQVTDTGNDHPLLTE